MDLETLYKEVMPPVENENQFGSKNLFKMTRFYHFE